MRTFVTCRNGNSSYTVADKNMNDAEEKYIRHIARHLNSQFSRESLHEQTLGKLVEKTFVGEKMKLVKAIGIGSLFCAHKRKVVSEVNLTNESLFVNGRDVLAMAMSLHYSIKMLTGVDIIPGGLRNVTVQCMVLQCIAL